MITLHDLITADGCRNPLRLAVWRPKDVPGLRTLADFECLGFRAEPAGHLQGHATVECGERFFYADTGEKVNFKKPRPCAHCGLPRSLEGHDGCIANLPDVKFACCGHGVELGYTSYGEEERVFDADGTFRLVPENNAFMPIPLTHPARGKNQNE